MEAWILLKADQLDQAGQFLIKLPLNSHNRRQKSCFWITSQGQVAALLVLPVPLM